MAEKQRSDLKSSFATMEDPRGERTKQQSLIDSLMIAICGAMCAADGWVDIEQCGNEKEDWLKSVLELPNGIPSHDPFGRVFSRLDPEPCEECFGHWVQRVSENVSGVIARDGKTLRRSHEAGHEKRAFHLVSA